VGQRGTLTRRLQRPGRFLGALVLLAMSALWAAPARAAPATTDATAVLNDALQAVVTQYAAQGVAHVGYVIADNAGHMVERDADVPERSASLYKLFVLWAVQRAIGAGPITASTIVTAAGLGPISVAEARRLMITESSNEAADALTDLLGAEVIQALPTYGGFPATTVPGVTTPREAARFMRRLIRGTLDPQLRPADYALMLGLLQDQQINTLLSPGFPAGVSFAHKTGNLPGVANDAGIVFRPDGRQLYLAVMAQGDGGENDGECAVLLTTIAQVVWQDLVPASPALPDPATG
jgi:beta-lactamase class A